MASEIRTWQIVNEKLVDISTTLAQEGRTEPDHLENWIVANPEILGPDLIIIGRQIVTDSGPIDVLAIDGAGNLVIVELKRGRLPRESLAQAVDYASAVSNWTAEKVSDIISQYADKSLEDALSERFDDIDIEGLNINEKQRILLVGCSIESRLERMIEWLSASFEVNINAIILSYVKTQSGDELLTKTAVISEDVEYKRAKSDKKYEIPMSDEPGTYDRETLKSKLTEYLSRKIVSAQRIRDVLLPTCLEHEKVTRNQLRNAFVTYDDSIDSSTAGYFISLISSQVGMKKNDFLRQVIGYGHPTHSWKKDNYFIREDYRQLVREVLNDIAQHAPDATPPRNVSQLTAH